MHAQKFIFRDLKPENILIDKDGYPIIIDFGFCKKVEDKTYTFCGTPNYVAPEIIRNVGHNAAVDWWAYGIVIYEMISGENPFYYDGLDDVSLFSAICEEEGEPLKDCFSRHVRKLVSKLLVKDPAKRLGMLKGRAQDVLDHEWFHGLNLKKLRAKKIKAPWIPGQENNGEVREDYEAELQREQKEEENKQRELRRQKEEEAMRELRELEEQEQRRREEAARRQKEKEEMQRQLELEREAKLRREKEEAERERQRQLAVEAKIREEEEQRRLKEAEERRREKEEAERQKLAKIKAEEERKRKLELEAKKKKEEERERRRKEMLRREQEEEEKRAEEERIRQERIRMKEEEKERVAAEKRRQQRMEEEERVAKLEKEKREREREELLRQHAEEERKRKEEEEKNRPEKKKKKNKSKEQADSSSANDGQEGELDLKDLERERQQKGDGSWGNGSWKGHRSWNPSSPTKNVRRSVEDITSPGKGYVNRLVKDGLKSPGGSAIRRKDLEEVSKLTPSGIVAKRLSDAKKKELNSSVPSLFSHF
jgi:hypothetical protein